MKLLKHVSLALIVAFLGLNLAACGGVKDTTIPAPPNSSKVETGQDPTIDMIASSMQGAMDQTASQQGMTMSNPSIYLSADAPAAVMTFYKKEMADRGWSIPKDGDQSGTATPFLAYESGDNAALIFAVDMTGTGTEGTMVYITNGTK